MATIRFSAASSATNATSLVVALGGTPTIGDLVVVFLATDNEIVVHQPGYLTTGTWFSTDGLRSPDSSSIKCFYHTWNASDSGSSATFTFSPAPALGVGDKDLSSANAVAIAVVMTGPTSTYLADSGAQAFDSVFTVPGSPLKLSPAIALHAAYTNGSTGTLSDSDGSAVSVQAVTLSSGSGQTLRVFSRATPAKGYSPAFSCSTIPTFLLVKSFSISDSTSQFYNPPIIEEGPVSEDRLGFRYKLQKYYTVFNNSGVYTAGRYSSTDQINAATQVFTNNAPVAPTDRTNILNSGVGGDFRATS